MKRAILTAALLTVVGLAACSSSESGAASASAGASTSATGSASDGAALPEGWARVEVEGEGFSIGIPEEWQRLSAEDFQDSGALEAMQDANPEAADAIAQAQQALANGQLQFFAFETGDRTQEAGFAANVNVLNVGDPGSQTIEDIADDIAQSIPQQIPVKGEVETETTTLPAGEAAVVRYVWTLELPNGESMDLAVTQYAVVTDEDGYVISLASPAEFADEYDAMWETMAESFAVE
jgi:hypothetical protein